MVTAGIFMVARISPLFELSSTALSFVLVIGAITALFMGFLRIIRMILSVLWPIQHCHNLVI